MVGSYLLANTTIVDGLIKPARLQHSASWAPLPATSMAKTLQADDDVSFWLPTHFLTDDDFISPETETEKNKEEDDFMAGLTLHETRHNPTEQKQPWIFSTSPQSTLTGFGLWSNRSGPSSNGSPNAPSRVPSPPVTPPGAQNDAAWELLYEAAEQVARLKLNAIVAAQVNHSYQNRGCFLDARRNPHSSLPTKSNGFYDVPNTNQGVKRQGGTMWVHGRHETENFNCHHHPHHQPRRISGDGVETVGLVESAWPPLCRTMPPHLHRNHRQNGGVPPEAGMRAMFLGDTGIKKQSVGTGVFLPRRPGTPQPPAEPCRKPTGGSPVIIPTRVSQALNLNLDEINHGVNPYSQARFGRGSVTNHEILVSRMNSYLENERSLRRNGGPTMAVHHHEVSLPIDWTY